MPILLLGWLLIFGGVAHFIGTFRGGGAKRVLFQILSAVVFVVAGLYLLTHPVMALGTLTALLALAIFAEGVFDTSQAASIKFGFNLLALL